MLLTDRQTGYPSVDKPWLKWYSGKKINNDFVNSTVWKNVYECNIKFANEIALIFQNKKILYKNLFAEVEKIADALVSNEIKKGDRIIVCATGTPETVYLLLACSKVGVCAEMINLSLGKEAIEAALYESPAKYVFCLDKIYLKLHGLLKESGKKIVVIPATYSLSVLVQFIVKITSKERCDLTDIFEWKHFLEKQDKKCIENVDSDSELVIVFSSGSTGKPKAIVHTNHSYTAISEQYRICEYPFKRKDVFLNQIPFFIASGLSFMLMAPLMLGITIVLEPVYTPKKWVEDICKYKPKVICATKSFWDTAIYEKLFKGKNLSFLNIAVQGGEPNTVQMENDINEILINCGCKEKIVVGYGMSELNGTLTTSSFKYHKAGSTGIPLPDVVISTFDTETGKENKLNERGEIMAMSPCVMKKYANNEELTEKFKWVDPEGRIWYRTGDIGYVDENGEIYVLGRTDDVIEVSGKKIYLFDIEKEVLDKFKVSACMVVANKADMIFVNIVSEINENIIAREVNNRVIKILPDEARFKVRVWKEFPMNANGKCDREALKRE